MLLSYDMAKSEKNETLRGLPFSLAEDFDWTTALIAEDRRQAYPEPRYQALGFLGEATAYAGIHAQRRNRTCDQPPTSKPTRKDESCRASRTRN